MVDGIESTNLIAGLWEIFQGVVCVVEVRLSHCTRLKSEKFRDSFRRDICFRDIGFRDMDLGDIGFRDRDLRNIGFRDMDLRETGFQDIGFRNMDSRDIGFRFPLRNLSHID